MKVCIISANLGDYDKPHPWADQIVPDGVEVEIHRLNDDNFPPRHKAMTPALQCGIPKWHGHELFPDFGWYLWVDASCALTRGNEVHLWLCEVDAFNPAGYYDIALFKHPERKTIRQEYDFIKDKMAAGNKYLCSRYKGEWLDEQMAFIANEAASYYPLYASTAFIYKPTPLIRAAFKEVAWQKYRFMLHDQLALAYALREHGNSIKVINQNYQKSGLMEFVRNKK